MIEIREATLDDVEAIVILGERGHRAGPDARFEFKEIQAKILVASCVCRRNMCAFVALKDANIVGFILGNSEEYSYIDMVYATDLATYSEHPGAGRKLVQRFERWAFDEVGADKIVVGTSYGGATERATTALYKRLGYSHVGGMFTKVR